MFWAVSVQDNCALAAAAFAALAAACTKLLKSTSTSIMQLLVCVVDGEQPVLNMQHEANWQHVKEQNQKLIQIKKM
jgi:hypothetical protein